MAIIALTGLQVQVAAATSGGTAPGGTTAPSGCTLTTPSDISTYVVGIQQEVDFDTPDVTTFGSGSFRNFVAGLKQSKCTISLLQDFAATTGLDALIGLNGTVVPVGAFGFLEIRPTNAARSTSNPGFICKFLNQNWSTFNAQVGAVPTISWQVQITGGFAELTA